MNKLLLFFFAILTANICHAQIANADFETWALSSGYLNPVGWTTSNGMSAVTNVVQGAPYAGTYSVHLLTDAGAGGGYLSYIYYGNVRPDVLSGWWKGTITSGDLMTATIQVLDGSFNEIGWGDAAFGSTQSSWTQFSAPVIYDAPGTPASFNIYFQLYAQSTSSEAYVDHISLTTTTGIEETDVTKLSVYPNPAHNFLNVECPMQNAELKMYDMTGRIVLEEELHSPLSTVNCPLSTGIYLVRVEAGDKVWQEKVVVE